MHSFKKIINQSINTCSLLHRGEEIQVLNQNGFHLAAQEFLEGKVPDVTQGHRFAFSGNLPGAISRTVQLSEIFHKEASQKAFIYHFPFDSIRVCSYLQFTVKENRVLSLFLGIQKGWDLGLPSFCFLKSSP